MKFRNIKISSQQKYAFWGTVVCGFLTYFYMITHHFLTLDSMWNLFSDQDMITSGRQFLMYACGISSYYDLPWVNGVLSILYLAVAAAIIVKAFQIKGRLSAVLTGALMITFPSVISTFCYSFTVDGYMLAILIVTVGFYLTDRYKWGFIAGIICTGLSLGIYQAYFSYLILLCIIRLMLGLLEAPELPKVWRKSWRYLSIGVGGYLFYIITLKLMLVMKEVNLSGYQGSDKVLGTGFSFFEIGKGLIVAVKSFLSFAFRSNVLTTTFFMKLAFILIVLCGVFLYFYFFIQGGAYKKIWRIILALCLCLMIPFGANLISIMAPESFFHVLMRYSWVVLFLLCIFLADRIHISERKTLNVIKTILQVSFVILIFQFMIVANIVAFNMNEKYEKTYGLCLRIVDRLEQCEGYKTGDEVALLGGGVDPEYYPPTSITEKDLAGYFGVNGEYCMNSTEKLSEFCKHYLNVTINAVSESRAIELAETDEFREMRNFPSEGSIQQIDGVWVICLNGGKKTEETISEDIEREVSSDIWPEEEESEKEPLIWYEQDCHIMHAMGETATGETLTNSKEAFEYNYEKGRRVFEVDLQLTEDKHYVLRHDWALDLGQGEEFGWTEEKKEAPMLEQFLQTPIYGEFTPLSWLDLLELMREHEDVFVVTDTKFSHTVSDDFRILVEEAVNGGYEKELKRIIVQIYYEDMYDEVESVYHFENYIFTTYYIELPEAKEAEAFCQSKGIPILVMPYTKWYDEIAETYSDTSLHVYVHTVNDSETARNLLDNGVYGIYTDCVELESGT